ncbi:hypothetical protein ISS21_01215 [Patescibacteria group bacterium]|nr:hypothetical protein [Patescibacteria group bacterium]
MKAHNFPFIRSTSVLVGTIVGAGIFGLPYAFAKSGFIIGLFYLLILTIVFLIIQFCYAEVILRTKADLEMPGYVSRYLGKKGKILITLSLVLGIYGALTAYLIGVGEFLFSLLNPLIGGSQIFWSLVFWAIASCLVLRGIDIVSQVEVVMALGLIFVVLLVFALSYPYLDLNNLKTINLQNLFFPYGVVLFALGGASALPTMRRILGNKVGLMRKSLILGILIPVLIYIIFCFSVIGVSGPNTSETALTGLAKLTNGRVLLIGGIFGILAMTTSFLALGFILRELIHRDYKVPLIPAWSLTVLVPILLFLLGLRSFILVISFAGGILSGIQGIVLIAAYYKAKIQGDRAPEFSFNLAKPIAYFIYLIFILGIIYQFIYV